MNDEADEWVVYSFLTSHTGERRLQCTPRERWESWFKSVPRVTKSMQLTLLAGGLTQEQAQMMVDLTREEE